MLFLHVLNWLFKKASYEAKISKAPQVPIICLDYFSKSPASFFPM